MNRIIKPGILSVIGFFLLFFLNQELKAQDSLGWVKTIREYHARTIREKLFVHTDREQYIAGEKLWLKIYSMDEGLSYPLKISRIVYLELLDKDLNPRVQIKAGLEDGHGHSYISIPKSMITGNYTLRAYTQWMKNENPEFYFTKTISVINPYIAQKPSKLSSKTSYTLDILPEGGNLVNGIRSQIGFKISDQNGKGVEASGWLTCLQTKKSVSLKTLYKGMGKFEFIPNKSLDYYLSFKLSDTLIHQKLPKAFDEGYTLAIVKEDSLVKVMVKCSPDLKGLPIYLLVENRDQVKGMENAFMKSDSLLLLIPKRKLGEGVIDFILFNSKGKPIADRILFERPKMVLSIEANLSATNWSKRSPIQLELSTLNPSGKPESSNLSLSVFLLDSLNRIPTENIQSYVFLRSEVKGRIENPNDYFNKDNPKVDEQGDLLMLTQGWRRIKWEEILKKDPNYFQYLPEREGFLIQGKVINKVNGSPVPHILTSLSKPGNHFDFQPCISDENGNVYYSFKPFQGNYDLVSQTINKADSNYRIDLENPFSEKFGKYTLEPLNLSPGIRQSLLSQSISSQIQDVFYAKKLKYLEGIKSLDTTRFYGIPDRNYNLDEYKRFTNMEEVIREYILDVHLRKKSGNFDFYVSNTPLLSFFDDPPLVLMDGVLIKDINKLMAFDPLKIKGIEVISRTYFQGPLLNEGIISFRTYKGDLAGFSLDPSSLSQEFKGLQNNLEFYSPQYESAKEKTSRLPDFRNELYWNPEIQTDNNGKSVSRFYTSDDTGEYAIVVQGRNSTGLYGSKILTFKIKN